MFSFEIDLSEFETLVAGAQAALPAELGQVAFDMGEDGERYVKDAMTALIYSQPERGYERTELLLDSAFGYGQITAEGFDVVVGAVGGANGRRYADYVDAGTYGSRREREQLLEDARATSSFTPRAYEREGSGLEARPFVEPSIAQLERELEEQVQRAIDRALV